MKKPNKIFFLYSLWYILIVCIGMWALSVNIKTNPIHQETYTLKAKIASISEENRDLELAVVSANRLQRLTDLGQNSLQMSPPKTVYYLQVP